MHIFIFWLAAIVVTVLCGVGSGFAIYKETYWPLIGLVPLGLASFWFAGKISAAIMSGR